MFVATKNTILRVPGRKGWYRNALSYIRTMYHEESLYPVSIVSAQDGEGLRIIALTIASIGKKEEKSHHVTRYDKTLRYRALYSYP